ncbi:hypothetical protein EV215_0170 [Hypnocyclicus thermotrophus]|uniref:Uncharacterized protein n=1 Tax=Hypnocyclicus thermotrophus TaxID=1627895 RepID=A0AA46I6E4_9FUSO|nr:hypothetical protein [Hypnocyclicus thermotrophus]TDT72370.1 hypothetical protein EV215_0170 [Hypnocyclicus thermotrophus]
MKTLIILIILAIPLYFSFKKFFNFIRGKESACHCDSKNSECSHCPVNK